MKTLKKLILVTLTVFAAQYVQAQSVKLMDPVSFKLKNGMTIIVAESKGASNTYASFVVEDKSVAPNDKAGVCELLNAMLNETVASISTEVSFDEKGGNIASASLNFYQTLPILSALVQRPLFTQQIFDESKAKLGAAVSPQLSLEDVLIFYRIHYVPANAYLTIAGDITPAAAKALVKKVFSGWGDVYLAALQK